MELLEAVDWPWVLVWSGLAGAAAMAWHAWRAGVKRRAEVDAMVQRHLAGRVVSIRGLEDDDARWQRGREERR